MALLLMAPLILSGISATLWSLMRLRWGRRFSALILIMSVAAPVIYVFGCFFAVWADRYFGAADSWGMTSMQGISLSILLGGALLSLIGAITAVVGAGITIMQRKSEST